MFRVPRLIETDGQSSLYLFADRTTEVLEDLSEAGINGVVRDKPLHYYGDKGEKIRLSVIDLPEGFDRAVVRKLRPEWRRRYGTYEFDRPL